MINQATGCNPTVLNCDCTKTFKYLQRIEEVDNISYNSSTGVVRRIFFKIASLLTATGSMIRFWTGSVRHYQDFCINFKYVQRLWGHRKSLLKDEEMIPVPVRVFERRTKRYDTASV